MSRSGSVVLRKWTSSFAAVLMLLVGFFQIVQGLVGVFNPGNLFLATQDYLFRVDASAWGWFHLLYGLVVAGAGLFILFGYTAARFIGVVVVFFQAVLNFIWLPAYPAWALAIIAFDVLIIWSLLTVRVGADDPSS